MENNSRYIRQTRLPQIGESGQAKLCNTSVLVVGAGGLGNAVLPYLTAAGIGTIGIIDGDVVALSNLHRQILFDENDLGKKKASVAKLKLSTQNSGIKIDSYTDYLTGKMALQLFEKYDIIIDATDSISARYLINDACVLTRKPFVHASVYRFQIQVSVFNYQGGPTYRCLYPTPPKTTQSCAEAGVLGTTVAYAGILQGNELMKMILTVGDVLSGKLLVHDCLTNQQNIFNFKLSKSPLITEEFFRKEHIDNSIQMSHFLDAKSNDRLFLDVRENDEQPKLSHKNIVSIPLNQIEDRLNELDSNKTIYIFCQSGTRSFTAYRILEKNHFGHIHCLYEGAAEINEIIK